VFAGCISYHTAFFISANQNFMFYMHTLQLIYLIINNLKNIFVLYVIQHKFIYNHAVSLHHNNNLKVCKNEIHNDIHRRA